MMSPMQPNPTKPANESYYDTLFGKSQGADMEKREKQRRKAAEETVDYFKYYQEQLQPFHRRAVLALKTYMMTVEDRRKRHEQWRFLATSPYGYGGVEANVASLQDTIWSNAIPVQAMAINRPQAVADKIENWFDYAFRATRFMKDTELMWREILLFGRFFRKMTHQVQMGRYMKMPTEMDMSEFDQAQQKAIEMGLRPPLPEEFPDEEKFMEAFKEFKKAMAMADVSMPDFPFPGIRDVVHYSGPAAKYLSFFRVFYDPFVEFYDSDVHIVQNFVPLEWVLRNTGTGNDKMFDPEAVARVIGDNPGSYAGMVDENQYEGQISQALGAGGRDRADKGPTVARKKVEILEAYHNNSRTPFRMVMDRVEAINKHRFSQYEHARNPLLSSSNTQVPTLGASIDEITLVKNLIDESNVLRGLRVDGAKMQVLPLLVRQHEAGLTDMQRYLEPGLIVRSMRGKEGLTQATNIDSPQGVDEVIESLHRDIDSSMGTPPTVRGQLGAPRISAQQSKAAERGVLVRQLLRISRFEDDLQHMPGMMLSIFKQYVDSDTLRDLGGKIAIDPLAEYTMEDFTKAINMDYRLSWGRKAPDEDVEFEKLQNLFTTFVNGGLQQMGWDMLAFAKKMTQRVSDEFSDTFSGQAPPPAPAAGGDAEGGGGGPEQSGNQGGAPGVPHGPQV